MRNLMIKLFFGGYSIKVGTKYVNFPKLAPWAVIGILSFGIGMANNELLLKEIGAPLTIISLFSFFYMWLKPLSTEELNKYFPKS